MGCHAMQSELFDADAILFILICELQSFSKAASAIGQTQSSVSRRIDALERRLGLTLLNRSVRPIAPTPEGRVLYHEIKRHANALEDTVGRIRLRNALNPVIRVGCVESLSLNLIPKLIEKLLPVTSRLLQITATSNTLVSHLLEHKLDMIVSSDLFPGIQGSIAGSYFGSRRYCYYPRQWLRAKRVRGRGPIFSFAGNPVSITITKAGADD